MIQKHDSNASACKQMLDYLTRKTEENNRHFEETHPKCQKCTMKSGSVPQPLPLSNSECMGCHKFMTKTKAERRERFANTDDAAVIPTVSEADVDAAVVAVQEEEIRNKIYKTISDHKEYLDEMMKNPGEHMLPGPGTVIQANVILTAPLIRELYERLKEEYAEHDIFLGAHASPEVLVFNYLW